MRIIISLFILWLAAAGSLHAQTVYITKTGAKYHREDCRYLKTSKIEVACADLSRKYTACSVCTPACEGVKTSGETPGETAATQCSATTQAGTRCKRKTTNGSGKCWQHE